MSDENLSKKIYKRSELEMLKESDFVMENVDMESTASSSRPTTSTTTENWEEEQYPPHVVTLRDIMPQVEFEPCRVCGKRSTGNHYGVRTCEACKVFFRRSKSKLNMGECVKGRRCEIGKKSRNCPQCRFNKCVEAGMTGNVEKQVSQMRYSSPADETKRNNLVNRILKAHEMACEYTEQKVKDLEIKEYEWVSDVTIDSWANRISAWEFYSEDLNQDIASTGLFIQHLEDELTMEDRATLLKKNAFSMHLVRITRALSWQGLQLSDGRLIRIKMLRLLYGDRLADGMVAFSRIILETFKLNDADLAFFLTMVYYQKVTEEDQMEFGIMEKRPEEFEKLEMKYKHLFYDYYKNHRLGEEKILNIKILLEKLNELDRMHKEDVQIFLHDNRTEFESDSYFGEIYLSRPTDEEENDEET